MPDNNNVNWHGITLGACLLMLVGIYLREKLAQKRDRSNIVFKAGIKLRNAFKDEIECLKSGDFFVWHVLPDVPQNHKIAIDEFATFLRGRRRKRFQKACQDYYEYCNKQRKLSESHVSNIQKVMKKIVNGDSVKINTHPDKKELQNALKHIQKVLSFAK